MFRCEASRLLNEAADRAGALLSWHRQQTRIFGLTVGQRNGCLDSGAQGVLINAIRGGARGAAVCNRANGDAETVFGHVLVNAVVGETREGADVFVNVPLGF